MRLLITAIFLSVILAGCNNEDKSPEGMPSMESVYFDYVIKGEEGGLATVKLQFRSRGATGGAMRINHPGGVLLDGQPLPGDSSGMSGVYYDSSCATSDFKGYHMIEVKSAEGKGYREKFDFIPFELADSIPATVKRSEWVVPLKNLPPGTRRMRIVLTDTSFHSSWINQQIPVEDGSFRVTEAMWSRLKSGPVGMELHLESNRKLGNATKAGGRMSITYSLKREFILED